jgi:hypothetical protein
MAASCTLAEIHLKLIDKMYSYLNNIDPTQWIDSIQVFYSPVKGWDNVIRIYEKKNKTNNVKFPFAVITRKPELSKENDISRRGWYTDYLKTGTTADGKQFQCLPVKVIYDMVIYDDTYNNMESICEKLIFMRGKNITHEYTSDLIGEKLNFFITYDDLPVYDMIPDVAEKYQGKGTIYSMEYQFKVDGIIAIDMGTSKRILNPILNTDLSLVIEE